MTTTVKALVAGAAIVITVAGASGAAFAAKNTQGNTRPGWGYGDKNHVHTGPPGQSVRP